MKEVVLQIPTMEAEQNIEIEVRINGRKKTIHYRVVFFESVFGLKFCIRIGQNLFQLFDDQGDLLSVEPFTNPNNNPR